MLQACLSYGTKWKDSVKAPFQAIHECTASGRRIYADVTARLVTRYPVDYYSPSSSSPEQLFRSANLSEMQLVCSIYIPFSRVFLQISHFLNLPFPVFSTPRPDFVSLRSHPLSCSRW